MNPTGAIGVFDSGLGGLTVLSAIHRVLPNESTTYLGDTARVPYGTKSPETIKKYALNSAQALLAKGQTSLMVVACNTVTAVALDDLRNSLKVPVLGVIEPSVKAAITVTPSNGSIAVLATAATTLSKAYPEKLLRMGFAGKVHSLACPLFVPLVEEGMISGPVAEKIAQHYLAQLPKDLDTVILGCTHYPLLLPLLKTLMPSHIKWVECGDAVAQEVKTLLGQNKPNTNTSHRYLTTEAPMRLRQLTEFFLGKPVLAEQVELIDIGGSI